MIAKYTGRISFLKTLLLASGTLLLIGNTGALAGSSNAASLLSAGKAQLSSGHILPAITKLQQAVNAAPESCEAHFCLGQAYGKAGKFPDARQQYRLAIRLGQGSPAAQKANSALLALPKKLLAPKAGPEALAILSSRGIWSRQRAAGTVARPVVLDFYASWCQPCRQVQAVLEKAQAEYGSQVEFRRINVDDPSNQSLIDGYEVSPIPTLVFLNSQGDVVSYSIGYGGADSVHQNIKKILPL
jgi:thioredoxin-like negative regulator of GroEL